MTIWGCILMTWGCLEEEVLPTQGQVGRHLMWGREEGASLSHTLFPGHPS